MRRKYRIGQKCPYCKGVYSKECGKMSAQLFNGSAEYVKKIDSRCPFKGKKIKKQ